MGIFGKTSGANERYSKYKSTADIAMQLVKEHANNLDRNFEEIMNLSSYSFQSLRLSSFLAGAVGDAVENKDILEMRNWKFITLNRAIEDVMTENGYKPWNLEYIFRKGAEDFSPKVLEHFAKETSFYHGGRIIAYRLRINDEMNVKFNLTIFLDTLEAKDGYYVDGVSNKSPM